MAKEIENPCISVCPLSGDLCVCVCVCELRAQQE